MHKPKPAPAPKKQEQKSLQFESVKDFLARIETLPRVYFDKRDTSYWVKLKDQYLQLGTRSIASHFIKRGLTKDIIQGIGWRQCDFPYLDAEENHVVDYAGKLAGHRIGVHKDQNGKTSLVTDEAGLGVFDPLPATGEPEFCREFIEELLPEDQWMHFCYWFSIALRSLRAGDFRPGQMVFFAGPAKCGKSLLQYIITQALGGRAANPFKFMFGETDFNYDLIGAEHWMFEDPATSTDIKSRRAFGERLKECCNNRDFRARKMQKDGELVRIFRRVTGSINSEIENLAQVPPLGDGVADKVMLFKCYPATKSLQRFIVRGEQPALKGFGEHIPKGQQDQLLIQETIRRELPALRGWLLRQFKNVPADLMEDRMGIAAWHHPDLLSEINSLAPEERLLQLIDAVLWDDPAFPTNWEGKSIDLEQELRSKNVVSEVERLFRFSNACGAYLGKLGRRHPHRVSNRKKDGYTVWRILPPSRTENQNNGGLQETPQGNEKSEPVI
jgi:hypothetical protein